MVRASFTRLALCAALIAAPQAARAQQNADRPPADLSWRVFTLSGARQTLEPLRGRVVVINSWATWCEPCVAELASMMALRQAVPDSGLAFALVAPQRREPVAAFIRRRGLTLPVFLEASPMPASFGFEAVPTTWIVDRRGRIAYRHRGAMDWNTPAMRARLTALLAEPGGAAVETGPIRQGSADGNRRPGNP